MDVYERRAEEWQRARSAGAFDIAADFARRVAPGALRLDLACGPGWHSDHLGAPVVATDAALAMLALVPGHAPNALRAAHDLEALPFAANAFGGIWAHKCLMHVADERVPLALGELHRASSVGAALHLRVTSDHLPPGWDDPFSGRHFSYWNPERLVRVVEGAGFALDAVHDDGEEWLDVEATRMRSLADVVGAGMRMLVVGLNPSIYAADVGVGFARSGNRFWPAAINAGLVTRDRDPRHALAAHGVGFTDLVKRATARAGELSADEYREGTERVRALVQWLQPTTVLFAGLSGYRIAVTPRARAGWQSSEFGGARCYVMPNPSGLNTHVTVADLAEHFRTAMAD